MVIGLVAGFVLSPRNMVIAKASVTNALETSTTSLQSINALQDTKSFQVGSAASTSSSSSTRKVYINNTNIIE